MPCCSKNDPQKGYIEMTDFFFLGYVKCVLGSSIIYYLYTEKWLFQNYTKDQKDISPEIYLIVRLNLVAI